MQTRPNVTKPRLSRLSTAVMSARYMHSKMSYRERLRGRLYGPRVESSSKANSVSDPAVKPKKHAPNNTKASLLNRAIMRLAFSFP